MAYRILVVFLLGRLAVKSGAATTKETLLIITIVGINEIIRGLLNGDE